MNKLVGLFIIAIGLMLAFFYPIAGVILLVVGLLVTWSAEGAK